jgi:hypothetical protein
MLFWPFTHNCLFQVPKWMQWDVVQLVTLEGTRKLKRESEEGAAGGREAGRVLGWWMSLW